MNGLPNLIHPIRREVCDVSREQILLDRRDIVESDRAARWNAVPRLEDDFRVDSPDGTSQRCDGHIVEFSQRIVAGQYQNRPPAERVWQVRPPDLSLGFSDHLAASIRRSPGLAIRWEEHLEWP
jgi:hypothetical protein